jgi:multidrug efflux pump subunit AcrB
MGMTMIVGIVTEIAIFYYSEFHSLPASDDRLILAGINRMRAISMTTFAAILALLPLRSRSVAAPRCSNRWRSRLCPA